MPCLGEVPGSRVVVIDNGSGDDSAERLRAEVEKWAGKQGRNLGESHEIQLVIEEKNWGFAGGNNVGLKYLRKGDQWVLLLNSDTLISSGVLSHCLGVMRDDPSIGVLSTRLDNLDGTSQTTARRLPTPARMTAHVLGLPWSMPRWFSWADLEDSSWDRRSSVLREVEWVGGAFMLVRREVIDRIGGLDQGFFFYGEDAEFCHRVRRKGWRVMYDGRVGIIHLGGGSSDPERLNKRSKDRLSWEARYLLQRRCYGRLAEWYLRLLDVGVYGLRTLKLWLTPSRKKDFETHREILSVLLTRPRARGM